MQHECLGKNVDRKRHAANLKNGQELITIQSQRVFLRQKEKLKALNQGTILLKYSEV